MSFTLWNDAYDCDHQFITNENKIVLFERYRIFREFDVDDVAIKLNKRGKWKKRYQSFHPQWKLQYLRNLKITHNNR